MFKINSGDLPSVVMDVVSESMSLLADFRTTNDNAYININSSATASSFDTGVAIGASNLADGSVLFGIAPYDSNLTDAISPFVIHNSKVGIVNLDPQFALDVVGDVNATSTYKMGGTTIVDSDYNFSNVATMYSTVISNSDKIETPYLYATNSVGINKLSADYTLDVDGDVNATTTYKMGGTTIVDSNYNFSNVATMYSTTIENSGLTTTNDLVVNNTITASNLIILGTATIVNTATFTNSNVLINNSALTGPAFVVNQLDANAEGIIAEFNDVNYNPDVPVFRINEAGSVGINTVSTEYAFNVNGSAHMTSNLFVDGAITADSITVNGSIGMSSINSTDIVTSNLSVYGTPLFGSNLIVAGDTFIGGTVYAAKVRLGSLYTTTTVNGTLAATLSTATQLGITQVGTLSNLTVANNITANTLTLGGFVFSVPSSNILLITSNGSNVAQFIA